MFSNSHLTMRTEFKFGVFLLIAYSIFVNFMALAQSPVEQSFKRNDIVPDVISRAPKHRAVVVYPNGERVNLGNELTPIEVKKIPVVAYSIEPETYYTLAFVDPDVPSRTAPIFRELNHWLVVNILGNNIAVGETLAEYIGPAPPKGSGLHRYVFLVYKQPDLIKFDEPQLNNTSTHNRTWFSIARFASKYSLGDPVFGNFFQAQCDD